MKLFRRNKTPDRFAELVAALAANPGRWFDYPENTIALGRHHFLIYDVQGDPATGRVQIRRKPQS